MIENRLDEDARRAEALRVFSYLDGELGPKARVAFEEATLQDASLLATTTSYRSLFNALDTVERFAPSDDFQARVLASLVAPAPSWLRLGKWFLGGPVKHRDPNPLTAKLDGRRLTRRQSRALAAFLATDPDARARVTEWKALFKELSALPAFQPPTGFQDQVMARIRAESASGSEPVKVRLRDRISGLWPRRRERMAALSGALFGPTAVVAGTAYLTLSNPLVTPSNLLSYMWAKGIAFVDVVSDASIWTSLEASALGDALGVLGGLTGPLLAAGLVAFGALTLISGWILYANVIKAPSTDRFYVAA